MNVLDRKLLREARASKGLILAITSLVAVGVMCLIYMRSAYNNLIAGQGPVLRPVPAGRFLDRPEKGAAGRAGRSRRHSRRERDPPADHLLRHGRSGTGRVPAQRLGAVAARPADARDQRHGAEARRLFHRRRRNEVLVNDNFARKHGLHPGQWIHLILNNRREELLIVGTAISSEFVYLVSPGSITPDPERFGVFYVKQTYAEEVFDMDGACNQVTGLLAPEYRDHPEPILAAIESKLRAVRRVRQDAARRSAADAVSHRRDQGCRDVCHDHAGDLSGGGGAGAQRADGAADRSAARDHRHAQGAGVFERADFSGTSRSSAD